MKRILLVQYFYKPFTSNQSFRYEQMINKLNNEKVKVDVLTSKHQGLDEIESYEQGTIYRVNSKFLMKKNIANNNIQTEDHNKSIIRKLKRILYKVIWPDFSLLWIPQAIIEARKIIKQNNYQTVISGSFPFSSHIVAYYIKKAKPEIKWIVDYIDPFAIIERQSNPANNVTLYKKLNLFAEKKINESADKIIIQNEAYNSYQKYFSKFINKVTVAPPMLGIDRDLVESVEPKLIDREHINIFFVGSLYKSIRNPEPVLAIFRELSRIDSSFHLHFVGDSKDCVDVLLRYKELNLFPLSIYGKVSREDAISYMKSADILLNISNQSEVQLPGKVVEYAYMKKRIINFAHDENNNSVRFFQNIGTEKSVLNIINEVDLDVLRSFIINNSEIEDIKFDVFFPENIGKLYF